jgi:hypothetical protein
MTVTDNEGLTGTSSRSVSASLPAGDTVVVDNREAWSWKYDAEVPLAGWNTRGFDASGWSTGNAVLGFGSSGLGTNINTFATTAERPIAAYYRRTFTVPDAGKATKLVLTTVGDDGVVVYVNGVEVGRQNMPTGAVSSRTYASSARRTTVANSLPLVVEVPVNLLVSGTNVVSAETHLNYRGTPDTSFDLKAVLTADR